MFQLHHQSEGRNLFLLTNLKNVQNSAYFDIPDQAREEDQGWLGDMMDSSLVDRRSLFFPLKEPWKGPRIASCDFMMILETLFSPSFVYSNKFKSFQSNPVNCFDVIYERSPEGFLFRVEGNVSPFLARIKMETLFAHKRNHFHSHYRSKSADATAARSAFKSLFISL